MQTACNQNVQYDILSHKKPSLFSLYGGQSLTNIQNKWLLGTLVQTASRLSELSNWPKLYERLKLPKLYYHSDLPRLSRHFIKCSVNFNRKVYTLRSLNADCITCVE